MLWRPIGPDLSYLRRVLVLNRAVMQATRRTFHCLMHSKSLKRRLADDRAAGADIQATMVPETLKRTPSDDKPRAKAFKPEIGKYVLYALFSPALNSREFLFQIIKKTNWLT